MFNKKLILSFILFLRVFIIISSSPSYDLATEGPSVMISTSLAGPDDYRHLISEYITVYADGTVVLSHEENPEKDAPTFQTKINKDDTRQIEDLIRDEKFQSLDEDVSTPSEDGEKQEVIVYFTDEVKKVSGWNPANESFKHIRQQIKSFIQTEDLEQWRTEISEYIWESDAKSKASITDFKTDEPFFILQIDSSVPTEAYDEPLTKEYALTLSGDLNVTIRGKDDKQIDAIEPLQITIDQNDMDALQTAITENFWKLSEHQSHADGSFEEAMTVNLKEISKTVSGKEPSNKRYVFI